MVAQAGQDVLIKIDINGSEDFVTLAGLRASTIALNAQAINATNMGSIGRWREYCKHAGVRSLQVSGNGIFTDEDSDARLRQLFFDGEFARLQIIIPDFGKLTADFHIGSLEYAGSFDGEARYDLSFASSGPIAFQLIDEVTV